MCAGHGTTIGHRRWQGHRRTCGFRDNIKTVKLFVYATLYRVRARENYFFVAVIDCYCRMNIQRLWKVRGWCPKLSCHCDRVKKKLAI